MMLCEGEYTIRERADLPLRVKGFVCLSPDGHYNIYVNARLSAPEKRRALRHEFDHIRRGDLFSQDAVWIVENETPPPRPKDVRRFLLSTIPGLMMAGDLPVPEPYTVAIYDFTEPLPIRIWPPEEPRPLPKSKNPGCTEPA